MGEIWSGQVGEIRAASTASGGTALTTTATNIQLPNGSYHAYITPRNFATAVVAKFSFNPWLVVLKTTDNMVTVTDYSEYAQDADAATVVDVSLLSTLANGDFLLVGSHLPFRGVYIDISAANTLGTATTSVYYWNGSAWVDLSATDGTNSTMTFAVDGLVYWTIPAAWVAGKLSTIYPITPQTNYTNLNYFWTRWSVSAALTDTGVTFSSMTSANRSTAYAELLSGQPFEERINRGLGGVGCIEALTNAGTANLVVNVATVRDGKF